MKTLNDLTAPVVPVRKLLEKDVQKKCVDWARARGYWARKISSPTQRSLPDYQFARNIPREGIKPDLNIKFAVEFKAPGKRPTEAQEEEIAAMRAAGWMVLVFDDVDDFKKFVVFNEETLA